MTVFDKQIERINFILDCGYDPNTKDLYGNTPLVVSLHRNNAAIVNLLIQAGADVNATNNSGSSVLHLATKFIIPDIVKILINNGANLDSKDANKLTPLCRAVIYDNAEVASVILSLGNYTSKRKHDGETALHYAITFGCKNMVALLIKHGISPNTQFQGQTAVQRSIENGKLNIALDLIKLGADPYMKNWDNEDARDTLAWWVSIPENTKPIIRMAMIDREFIAYRNLRDLKDDLIREVFSSNYLTIVDVNSMVRR